MVIFHSDVSLPEGNTIPFFRDFDSSIFLMDVDSLLDHTRSY